MENSVNRSIVYLKFLFIIGLIALMPQLSVADQGRNFPVVVHFNPPKQEQGAKPFVDNDSPLSKQPKAPAFS